MSFVYLTPASISYLNQFLLALLITIYLGIRYFAPGSRPRRRQDSLLVAFFICVTIFSLLLFLEASCLPSERIVVVYFENTVLGLLLVTLIQFAYHFPVPSEKQKVERIIALVMSCAYVLWEAEFAIQRFNLLRDGQVIFREFNMDKAIVVEFGWIIFVFVRNSIRNWKLPATRQFALIFLVPLWLSVLNFYRGVYRVPTTIYHINVSIGILFTTFLFALIYLASQPERTSFVTKLSGTVITSVLAVFGVVAWLVTPAYANQYIPSILDHRTIHFVPNERGGYDVSEIPFYFEQDLGQRLEQIDVNSVKGIDFDFPFFGQPYSQIFISSDGAIGLGTEYVWRNFQYHFANIPMIFPLLVDLDSYNPQNGGIFLRQEASQAVITYYKMPSQNHPDAKYTFQVSLFPDGSFDFTYNGLPELTFYVDDRAEATAWAIGVKPAQALQGSVNFSSMPIQGGPEGLLQDEYRLFRIYLHEFLLPLALAVLVSSLLFLIGLPLILNFSLAHPLNSLLKGVQAFNSGQREATIPVQFNDEIGYLTESFNNLSSELNNLITNLENRVTQRTLDLCESEERYRQLFDLESDAIFIIRNSDGQILEANSAAAALYGFNHEEILSKCNTDLSAEPESTQEATNTPAPSDSIVKIPLRWHRKKDGTRFPVGITARFVTWKNEPVHIAAIRDITEQYQIEQELLRLAITDELTSLPNRRHFLAQAERFFARSNQPPDSLAIMMLDLDYLKTINDQYGHTIGDLALQEIVHILAVNLRPTDLLARFGGDEFAILLPRTLKPKAHQIGERLCQTLANTPIRAENHDIRITVSIGVAAVDQSITSLDELLIRADQALYLAKKRGRNRCEIWGEN